MAAGVEASISVSIRARQTGTADLGTPTFTVVEEKIVSFLAGTANDNQANVLFSGERELASGAAEDLDLAGALTSALGSTITAAEITAIYLAADAGNTTNLTFFGDAEAAFDGPLGGTTPTLTLKPGDMVLMTSKDGWTVTATTADLLQASNGSGAAATYRVILIGRTSAT